METAVAEEGRLLVAGDPCDRGPHAGELAVAYDLARPADLRQQRSLDTEELEQLVVPFERVEPKEHRPRRVGHVGRMDTTASQLPDEPGIDGAEREPAGAAVAKQPLELRRREVGVEHEARAGAQERLVTRRAQRVASFRGTTVLPHERAVERRAGRAIPQHGCLALVRDPDRHNRCAVERGDDLSQGA